ncbi:MAG TPA: RNA pyrophosphohydrolase [Stellaceae bacterium]|nr:RNA pyrophosphohydrolase [Stellaceae bacterium]
MLPVVRAAAPGPEYRRNVGLMLLNPTGLAWVGQRIDTPGAWQMPQGGIDHGEDPETAAKRELKEEIGTDAAEILFASEDWLVYDLPPELVGKVWKGERWRGQAQRWFALRFLGSDRDIRIDGHDAEFSAWRWARRDELAKLIVGFKRPVYEALLAEFEPRLRALGLPG